MFLTGPKKLLYDAFDMKYFRAAHRIEENPYFFTEPAAVFCGKFDSDITGGSGSNGRFGPFGSRTTTGSAHRLQ